jgi:hypothetical protein
MDVQAPLSCTKELPFLLGKGNDHISKVTELCHGENRTFMISSPGGDSH